MSANAKVCYYGKEGLLKIDKYENLESNLAYCVSSCQLLQFLDLVIEQDSSSKSLEYRDSIKQKNI